MPATLTYPGVYIQEIPSGSRTITGVATAVAAFVGRAARGPVDEPVAITSLAQYERTFGALSRDAGMGYAVRDYYLNGGRQAVIVRLAAGATPATVDLDGLASLVASGPGTWGNALEVEVEAATDPEASLVAAQQGVDADQLFHLTVREGTLEEPLQSETYPNVTLGPGRAGSTRCSPAPSSSRTDGAICPTAARPARPPVHGRGGLPGRPARRRSRWPTTGQPGRQDRALRPAARRTCSPSSACRPRRRRARAPDACGTGALTLCVDERAFLLVDPPARAAATAGISDWVPRRGLTANGRNAAVYFPRIRRPGPAARRRDRRVRALRRGRRDHGPHRRRARRVEGAGRDRGRRSSGASGLDGPADRRRERRSSTRSASTACAPSR